MKNERLMVDEPRIFVIDIIKQLAKIRKLFYKTEVLVLGDLSEDSDRFIIDVVKELLDYELHVVVYDCKGGSKEGLNVEFCSDFSQLNNYELQKEDHRFPKKERFFDVIINFQDDDLDLRIIQKEDAIIKNR